VWRSGGVPYSTFLRRRRSIYRAARAAPGCCLPLLMLDSTSRNWPIASFRGDAEFGRYRVIAGPSEPSARQIMSSCTTAKQKPNKRKRTGMIGLQLVNASSASFEQKRSNANLLYLSLSFRLAVKNNHSMIPAPALDVIQREVLSMISHFRTKLSQFRNSGSRASYRQIR
jgi:hypothetical protein